MLTNTQNSPALLPEGVLQTARVAAEAVAAATHAARRAPGSVTLVAVSKHQSTAAVAAAYAAGLTHFGENYLQEGVPKIASLAALPLIWHFIGAVQANKTRAVATHFDWVHTVDRLRVAERLAAHRSAHQAPLNICLQVMLVPEAGKAGVSPEALPALAHAVARLPGLQLRGLMCIPPATDDPATRRERFRTLADLLSRLQAEGLALDTLSMGMSADYTDAILEGATQVRLGTAVFGERPQLIPAQDLS